MESVIVVQGKVARDVRAQEILVTRHEDLGESMVISRGVQRESLVTDHVRLGESLVTDHVRLGENLAIDHVHLGENLVIDHVHLGENLVIDHVRLGENLAIDHVRLGSMEKIKANQGKVSIGRGKLSRCTIAQASREIR